MEQSFYDSLIETGTVHVVVASGYNVVVVGSVVLNLLVYLMRRQQATLLALIAMVGYGWLAGGEAPVVRAVIMGSLVFLARATGRQTESGWLLVVAGWLMLMVNPQLIESVSFQLSLAATAGLIWVEPKIREGMERVKSSWMRVMMETELSPTLAAQITTAPIIWWNFGRLSLISPVVNMLVLPLVPMMMGLGAGQLVLGRLVAPFTYAVAHLFVVIVRWFG
jgi:competence protein ComEC